MMHLVSCVLVLTMLALSAGRQQRGSRCRCVGPTGNGAKGISLHAGMLFPICAECIHGQHSRFGSVDLQISTTAFRGCGWRYPHQQEATCSLHSPCPTVRALGRGHCPAGHSSTWLVLAPCVSRCLPCFEMQFAVRVPEPPKAVGCVCTPCFRTAGCKLWSIPHAHAMLVVVAGVVGSHSPPNTLYTFYQQATGGAQVGCALLVIVPACVPISLNNKI
jgi:hypothetical protein